MFVLENDDEPMDFGKAYFQTHIPTYSNIIMAWWSQGCRGALWLLATGLERGRKEAEEAGRPALPLCVCQYSSKDGRGVRGTAKPAKP